VEARLRSGEEFGIAGLKSVLRKHATLPMAQRAQQVLDAVRDADVHDDLTLLMIDSSERNHVG